VAFPGFLLLLVAQITITVALIRSKALPLWVPIVFAAGFVLETALAGNGGGTTPLWIPQIVAEVAIGWYALRKASAAASPAV